METSKLAKFRDLLNEMRSAAVEAQPGEIPAECSRGDAGDASQNQLHHRLTRELSARNAANVRRIDAALHRIRDGSFGTCSECEEPIEEQRLESRPITTLCVSCKEDEERMQSNFFSNRKRTA